MSSAILLVNVGSPKNASRCAVAKFLFRYLNDRRVVTLPFLARTLLVNGIIIPFRLGKSAKRYRDFFSSGVPTLLHHAQALERALNEQLPQGTRAFVAMQHSRPSLAGVLRAIRREGFDRLTLIPLFPQYAEATSGSIVAKFYEKIVAWSALPEICVVESFYGHPLYIRALADTLQGYDVAAYDHVVFSYHSLPITHIARVEGTPRCYATACETTSRLLAEQLQLDETRYSTAYQSYMSPHEWLAPFINDVLAQLAARGCKRLLLLSPGMTADCLETAYDLAYEGRKRFIEHGGETLDVAPCLNSSRTWVKALMEIADSRR
ncbi:MAG: ferrochelatase [Prevotellaceae bacterium]|jgi:ferrochelatase|nr:ferrochelatase [Prevotellaceae bacterium]